MSLRARQQPPAAPVAPALVPAGQHLGKPGLPLTRAFTLAGSRQRAHLHLLSRSISKAHAAFVATASGVYVRDLASRTQVIINGKPVREAVLSPGDSVKLGTFAFRYVGPPAKALPAPVPATEGALEVDASQIPVPIEGRTVLIGRRPTCDIPLTELSVSICHALIFEIDGVRYIRDLGSRTGTLVNGKPIHHQPIQFGDTIRVGDTQMRYVSTVVEDQFDELEDLVGTAPLDDDLAPLAEEATSHRAAAYTPPTTASDLDSVEEDALNVAGAGSEASVTQSLGSYDPLASEPEEQSADSELDLISLVPLDLAGDAPVSESRAPESSLSMPEEFDLAGSGTQTLADPDLNHERLSGSGTFAGMSFDPAEQDRPPSPAVEAHVEDLGLEFWDEQPAKSLLSGTEAEEAHGIINTSIDLMPSAESKSAAKPVLPIAAEPATDVSEDLLDLHGPGAMDTSDAGSLASVTPVAESFDLGIDANAEAAESDTASEAVLPVATGSDSESPTHSEHEAEVLPLMSEAEVEEELAPLVADRSLDTPVAEEAPSSSDQLRVTENTAAETEYGFARNLDASTAATDPLGEVASAEVLASEIPATTSTEPAGQAHAGGLSETIDVDAGTAEADEELVDLTTAFAPAEPTSEAAKPDDSGATESSEAVLTSLDLEGVLEALPESKGSIAHEPGAASAASEEPTVAADDEALPDEVDLSSLDFNLADSGPVSEEDGNDPDASSDPRPLLALDPTSTDSQASEAQPPQATSPVGTEPPLLKPNAVPDAPSAAEGAAEPKRRWMWGRPRGVPKTESASADSETSVFLSATGLAGAAAAGAAAEVIESTVPTPESAQGLAAEIPPTVSSTGDGAGDDGLSVADGDSVNPIDLTDSSFGRAMDEFSGSDQDLLEVSANDVAEPSSVVGEPPASETAVAETPVAEIPVGEIPAAETPVAEASLEDPVAGVPADNLLPGAETQAANGAPPTEFSASADSEPGIESFLLPDDEEETMSFDQMAEAVLASDELFEEPTDLGEEIGFIAEYPLPSPGGVSSEQNLDAALRFDTEVTAPQGPDIASTLGAQVPPLEFSDESSAGVELPLASDESPEFVIEPDTSATSASRDPFYGMGRDLGSFIGGVLLPLNSDPAESVIGTLSAAELPADFMLTTDSTQELTAENFAADPAEVSAAAQTVAETTSSTDILGEFSESSGTESVAFLENGEESLANFLEKLDTAEPPAELFESSPEALDTLPDSMQIISDVEEVLGPAGGKDSGTNGTGPTNVPAGPTEVVVHHRGALSSQPMRRPPAQRGGRTPTVFGPDGSVAIPPTAAKVAVAPGSLTTAFDGLAMPPVRETDVFSQMPSAGPARGRHRRGANGAGAAPVPAAPRSLMGLTGYDPAADASVAVARSAELGDVALGDPNGDMPTSDRQSYKSVDGGTMVPRFPGHPSELDSQPWRRRRRRSRMRLGILLPIIVLLAIGSAVAIYYLVPTKAQAQIYLKFNHLDKTSINDRAELERQQRELLRNEDTRQLARDIYLNNGGRLGDGFLYADSPQDSMYASLVGSATVPPIGEKLILHADSKDPAGDRIRLRAVIDALYSKNKPLADRAGSAKAAWDKANAELTGIKAQIDAVSASIKQEQQSSQRLNDALALLATRKKESGNLWKTWTDAAATLRDAQADVDRLDVTPTAVNAAVPAPNAAPQAADNDPQVKELADKVTKMNADLAKARGVRAAAADAANKALDKALGGFQDRISEARGTLKDGSELSSYLAAAQMAQDTIRQLNADLIERQKTDQQRLNELRRVLAEKQEARLKAAWDSDNQLQQMQQDLSVKEHRYNAAVGSGLEADARKLKGELELVKKQIDARRDLIGTGDIFADEVRDLQQFIDASLAGMEHDRRHNDQRMAEALKALAAAAPKIEKLPADQKALAEDFEKRLSEMNEARRQYATAISAAAPDADAQVKKLESDSTELQAKLDARRKQIADENRKALTKQQEEARVTALALAKAKLDSAKEGEAAASVAVRANKEQVDAAQVTVDKERLMSTQLITDSNRAKELEKEKKRLDDLADAQFAIWQQSIVPEAPTDDNIQMTDLNDPRKLYMLGSSLGFALLMVVVLIAFSGGGSNRTPETSTEVARPEPLGELEVRGIQHETHDHEEEPLTV